MDAPLRGNGKRWVKMMQERNPKHARLYCEHGHYIGSNKLFQGNCEECKTRGETEERHKAEEAEQDERRFHG